MKRFAIALLAAGAGYVIGAVAGYALVSQLSANVHDRDLEAAMTGAFVFGPLGALVGGAVGFFGAARRTR